MAPLVVESGRRPRRRAPLYNSVVHRTRPSSESSPGELRDGGVDARKHDERTGSSDAVSLAVQPELVLALREALVFAPGIKAAFVYGAAARSAPAPSLPRKRGRDAPAVLRRGDASLAGDIDLMVIGEATYADCFGGLLDAEKLLGRRIRARFVSAEEWQRELARRGSFAAKVAARRRIFIFRSADDARW